MKSYRQPMADERRIDFFFPDRLSNHYSQLRGGRRGKSGEGKGGGMVMLRFIVLWEAAFPKAHGKAGDSVSRCLPLRGKKVTRDDVLALHFPKGSCCLFQGLDQLLNVLPTYYYSRVISFGWDITTSPATILQRHLW